MKNMTVRGIDKELAEKLRAAARAVKKSVNQVVIDTLEMHFGLKKEKKYTHVYHDLDHLFGRWSEEEYRAIQEKIEEERRIDTELWEIGEHAD